MKILADENMPMVQETFGREHEIVMLPGRLITREDLRDVDVLLVRSVTKVNEALLQGTPVKFVGTATIGTDHLDITYLESCGIHWCSAKGCNADSVADYVTAAILEVSSDDEFPLDELTLGVIGCGNVGSRVVRRGEAMGMLVQQNDPPLARATGDSKYVHLRKALDCDIITLHTPLTLDGPDATYHLINDRRLNLLKEESMLINTSRGAVVDNLELKSFLQDNIELYAILDVWENEPNIDAGLYDLVYYGTPHIAGYSIEGKLRGTWQIYDQFRRWQDLDCDITLQSLLETLPPCIPLFIDSANQPDEEALRELAATAYSVVQDHYLLDKISESKTAAEVSAIFDNARKTYQYRREFSSYPVQVRGSEYLLEKIRGIGFTKAEGVL